MKRLLRSLANNKLVLHNAVPVLLLLCLSIPQVAIYIHNIGPWTMPDPNMHVGATYALATGQITPPTKIIKDEFGNTIRRPILHGDSHFLNAANVRNDTITTILDNPFMDNSAAQQYQAASKLGKRIIATPRATQYSPVSYIPQALGLRMGLSLHENPYTALQLAHVTNYITCLLIFLVAIILSTKTKLLIVLIAILPTTCFASATVMPDGLLIALSSLLVAIITYSIDKNQRMKKTAYIAAISVSVLLLTIKAVYLVPALLLFVLPSHILGIVHKIIYTTSLIVFFFIYLIWSRYFSGVAYRGNYEANLTYLKAHPLHLIASISANMILDCANLIAKSAINYASIIAITTIAVIYFLQSKTRVTENGNLFSNHRYVICAIIGTTVAWFLIYLFIALTWNQLSDIGTFGHIEGVQGRYILPLLPLLATFKYVNYSK